MATAIKKSPADRGTSYAAPPVGSSGQRQPRGGDPLVTGTLAVLPDELPISAAVNRRVEYRCECGHVLRTFGGGRHRVFFEPGDTGPDEPVMNGACPACGRELPGKNRS